MWEDVVSFFKPNDAGDAMTRIVPHEYPFVAFRPLQVAHVNKLYWKGDPELPESYARPPARCTFVIGIQDWMTGQDSSNYECSWRRLDSSSSSSPRGTLAFRSTARRCVAARARATARFRAFTSASARRPIASRRE